MLTQLVNYQLLNQVLILLLYPSGVVLGLWPDPAERLGQHGVLRTLLGSLVNDQPNQLYIDPQECR